MVHTAEEIKKGLEVCATLDGDCESCPYDDRTIHCSDRMRKDALAYIQQLESRLAQVERERDAAVYDIAKLVKRLGYGPCRYCRKTYDTNDATCSICVFEWRGVCPENTKEEK